MATRTRHPLARPAIESLEQRLALTISYAIAPGATLDVYPLSSIIPAAPAGMDRMEVLLTSVPGVSHGTLYRVSGTEAYPWGSPAPNIFTVGAGNNRITAGEGFRYVNNGTGDGTTETIPVKFRDGTGFTTATDTIVITVNSHLTPPTITAQPNTFIQIPPGGTATMSVTAAGTPAPTYQWYQGIAPDTSRPIAGATSTSYTTPALSAVQQYVYWVQAKNTGGVANSLVVTVQVATPTTLATTNASAAYSTAAQAVNLSGTVSPAENVGNVTFTSAALNASARSGTVTNGLTGPTGFVIPAGAKAGTYAIAAQYDAPAGIASSTDTKTLTITAAATTTAATASPTAVAATAAQTVALSAKVTSPAGAVNEGTATFTLKNGAVVIGTATTVAVANGAASVGYVLPANTPAGAYAVAVAYNPGADYTASGDATTALKVAPAVTASTAAVQATGGTLTIKGVGFSATAANDSVAFSPAVSGGSVTAATPTSLTYTFASAPPAGTLSAIVTANGVAGTQVQVATVLLLPTWLTPAVPGSAVATWNQARQTLAITGVATLTADPLASGDIPVVTVAGGGGALIVTPASDRQIHVNGLTVADGGQVAVSRTTAAGGPTVFAIGGAAPLSLGSTGKLNLTNNDLVVADTGLSAVAALVANGAIVSGLTDAAHLHALGVVQNDRGGTPLYTSANPFDGAVPGASDILVKYTYYGDGNLDGRVNAADYTRVDATFVAEMAGPIVTGWFTGDFNADGVVDGSDYALMDNAFNQQGAAGVAATPAVVASPAAEAARPAAPTGRAAATSRTGDRSPKATPASSAAVAMPTAWPASGPRPTMTGGRRPGRGCGRRSRHPTRPDHTTRAPCKAMARPSWGSAGGCWPAMPPPAGGPDRGPPPPLGPRAAHRPEATLCRASDPTASPRGCPAVSAQGLGGFGTTPPPHAAAASRRPRTANRAGDGQARQAAGHPGHRPRDGDAAEPPDVSARRWPAGRGLDAGVLIRDFSRLPSRANWDWSSCSCATP